MSTATSNSEAATAALEEALASVDELKHRLAAAEKTLDEADESEVKVVCVRAQSSRAV